MSVETDAELVLRHHAVLAAMAMLRKKPVVASNTALRMTVAQRLGSLEFTRLSVERAMSERGLLIVA